MEAICTKCGSSFRADDEFAGKTVKCKYCKQPAKVRELEKPKPINLPAALSPVAYPVAKVVEHHPQTAYVQRLTGSSKHDDYGAWCPHCGNRCSEKLTHGQGWLVFCFIVVSMGLALLLFPFLPQEWHCNECEHRWKA